MNKIMESTSQSAKGSVAEGTVSELTEAQLALERRVVRKIDLVVLPLMCLVYFFQYLDKQSIGYAAVFDLREDLDMLPVEYSWSLSLFYFGQFVAEYFFIYLMSVLPITRFVGIFIVLWGVMAGCLAAPQNFGGFGAVRFLLGFCEGGIAPAFVIITSTWYKRSEHGFRVATWVSFNGVAQIVGALMMYGIGLADNLALHNWRVMFLICGGGTIVTGVIFILMMPAGPASAWFLNEEEREMAVQRLERDSMSKDRSDFQLYQLVEALKDPKTWAYLLMGFFGTMASPVLKFASLVINGFGWSKFNTMLVGLPAGLLQIVFIWIPVVGMRTTKIPRSYWGMGITIIPLVGNIGIKTIPASNKWGVVCFTWLATLISPVLVIIFSLMASNVKGNTKKSAVNNMFFVIYAAAAIAAPQLWSIDESPRFAKGITTDLVCLVGLMVVFLAFGLGVSWENAKRDREEASGSPTRAPVAVGQFVDLTDKQDRSFRYTS